MSIVERRQSEIACTPKSYAICVPTNNSLVGVTAMKRIINGFQVDWVGNDRIELTRTTVPMHQYVFETSPDRKRLKRHDTTSPVDVPAGDPLVDANRFDGEARKAAQVYLRSENAA